MAEFSYKALVEPIPLAEQHWVDGTLPLVSISCITYNHSLHIREALEGFLMQRTTFPVEILVHDDASMDGTADILKQYSDGYGKLIHPVYQSENQYLKGVPSISARFNFPRARGKYIAMCEGDDYWTDPLKLQKQADFLERHDEYAACFTNAEKKNEMDDVTSIYVTYLQEGDVSPERIIEMGGSIFPTATLMFRNHLIDKDVLNYLLEDLAGDTSLIIAIAMHGKVLFMDQVTAIYRMWHGGLYSRISKDPQQISEWKIRRIKGYKKLQGIVTREWIQVVKGKVSSESLYVVQNWRGGARFRYLFNLTFLDFLKLLWGYVKSLIRVFAPNFRRPKSPAG